LDDLAPTTDNLVMENSRRKHPSLNAAIQLLEARQLLSTYFVDATSGSDLNTGRSPRQAWQSLAAVSAHSFKPHDKILLTGTFAAQTLVLGRSANGVSVNSYRPNRARTSVKIGVANAALFTDVLADGIDITTSNITIQNITITASPTAIATGNYNYGIYLHNNSTALLSNEIINRITATGFSYSGLCMQGWNTTTANSAGFSNVLIENSTFNANQVSGIFVAAGDNTGNEFQPAFPANFYANSNLTIKACRAYDNAGYNAALKGTPDGVNINQGNFTAGGIFISSVNGAIVQNCTVYNNCFASLASVGTWAFDSTHVNFQNDDSYDNKTAGIADGDGFDFDHGVTDSIMQYDYSHGNVGAGFLLATTGGSSNNEGDTIRYCISDDNGSGIYIQATPTVPVLYANIYNNTVLTNGQTFLMPNVAIAIAGDNSSSDSINILNNIFFSSSSNPILLLTAPEPGVHFQRNDYWQAPAPQHFIANVAGTLYTSLTDWSAATGGQEMRNGINMRLVQDPILANETVADRPKSTAPSLALSRRSPLRSAGLNLTTPQWAATAPYDLNAPYNLAGPAWNGLGKLNFFSHPINRRGMGAG